jgi:putative tricarboxylic transport membrane protein
MNALDGILYGFSVALTPGNLLAALIGSLIGTFVGVLPGLGPVGAMALLLSTTLTLKPVTAVIMLAAIYYGAMYGGSTTSILVNVPGESASVVTCFDGYQMAKRGRAGAALTIAAVGSFVAGSTGLIGLMLFAPTIANFALSFGSPEYTGICLLGLIALTRISSQSFWKGLIVLGIGLALATVGMEPVSGRSRFTFGIIPLMQGIDLIPVAMGLFGVAEVFLVAEQAGGLPQISSIRLRELFPNGSEWRRSVAPILRGTGIGFLIGLIPGPSATISAFASYDLERRCSKQPEEFGKGAIEGVAGPESANNAATSGAMVPMLALGIPFSPPTALLLAALIIQGVQPGPLLIQNNPEVFWGVIASMYIGNVALLILNIPLIGMWVSFLRTPQPILLAAIFTFVLIGTYSVNNSIVDLIVLMVMGCVGYILRKLNFDVAPMILAIVLGPFMERSFRQSLYMSNGDLLVFLERPISAILLFLVIAFLFAPIVWRLTFRRRLQSPEFSKK